MKIYTGRGDKGQTDLLDQQDLSKADDRLEAIGTIDELNASIGVLLAEPSLVEEARELLAKIQSDLFSLGASLAGAPPTATPVLQVTVLEQAIDQLDEGLPALENFILPSGSRCVALCHQTRTTVRRAERRLVAIGMTETVAPINRLSDYLFVLARRQAKKEGRPEVLWKPGQATNGKEKLY